MKTGGVKCEMGRSSLSCKPGAATCPHDATGCYYDSDRFLHCVPHGEHIVYMGDSLERFEWLALALSLKRGWELGGELPSPLVSSEWPKWSDFFRGTTAMLAPHVRCDCFRRDDVRNRTHPLWMRQLLENRYFWIPGVLNLTLIGAYNLNAVQGGWVPGDPDANRAGPHAAFAARWRYNWSETIRRVVAKLEPPPTALVMNAGHWGRFRESELAEIVAAARESMPHARLIWKSTTAAKGEKPRGSRDALASRLFPETFDAGRITDCCPASLLSPPHHRYFDDAGNVTCTSFVGRPSKRGAAAADAAAHAAQPDRRGRCHDSAHLPWDGLHFGPPMYSALARARLERLYGPPGRCEYFRIGECWVFRNASGQIA